MLPRSSQFRDTNRRQAHIRVNRQHSSRRSRQRTCRRNRYSHNQHGRRHTHNIKSVNCRDSSYTSREATSIHSSGTSTVSYTFRRSDTTFRGDSLDRPSTSVITRPKTFNIRHRYVTTSGGPHYATLDLPRTECSTIDSHMFNGRPSYSAVRTHSATKSITVRVRTDTDSKTTLHITATRPSPSVVINYYPSPLALNVKGTPGSSTSDYKLRTATFMATRTFRVVTSIFY